MLDPSEAFPADPVSPNPPDDRPSRECFAPIQPQHLKRKRRLARAGGRSKDQGDHNPRSAGGEAAVRLARPPSVGYRTGLQSPPTSTGPPEIQPPRATAA